MAGGPMTPLYFHPAIGVPTRLRARAIIAAIERCRVQ
jgi:hypothetical protein